MTTMAMPARRALATVLLCTLAACGDANSPGENGSSKSADWSTLGTRSQTADGADAITANDAAQWTDYEPAPAYPGTVNLPLQYITMADGTRLAAYVTLPADAQGQAASGRFPVILQQTAYNGTTGAVSAAVGTDKFLVQQGYASVVVDVRGTGQSQGVWEAFGEAEQADYREVVEWAASQGWSDGRIGVTGVSYLGITAILTAAQRHPAVKAAFPIVPIGDGYRDIVFTGGQVNSTFIPVWLGLVSVLGVTNPTLLTDPAIGIPVTLQHVLNAVTAFQVPLILQAVVGDPDTAYDGAFWNTRSPLEVLDQVEVPTFVVGGLHDLFQRSEPMTYEALKHRVPAKLLMGPWTHIQAAVGQGLPVDGVPAINRLQLRWFDQYVKGLDVDADALPNVTQWVKGHEHYATASDWPHPQAAAQRWYLRGDKTLTRDAPAAEEKSNAMLQTPIQGLCSISASQWTAGALGLLPLPCFSNSNASENWAVKYDSAPMTEDFYLNGPIEADVWISTTASDASVSVRVDDVDENGIAKPLTNGLQTASLRAVDASRSRTLDGESIQPWHPYTQASVQEVGAGNKVLVPVEVFQTAALIRKGHRLRIAVSTSNLPQGVPPLPTLLQSLLGVMTVYSDAEHASSVVVPVVPAAELLD